MAVQPLHRTAAEIRAAEERMGEARGRRESPFYELAFLAVGSHHDFTIQVAERLSRSLPEYLEAVCKHQALINEKGEMAVRGDRSEVE